MIIKRIEPFQCAKVMGMVYAIVGFILGILFSLFALVSTGASGLPFGWVFGVGAIILLPLLYGLCGFIGMLIVAALYNQAAKWVGGIEIQVE